MVTTTTTKESTSTGGADAVAATGEHKESSESVRMIQVNLVMEVVLVKW